MYNPFKPHIVVFRDGKYGVRRAKGLFFWEFLDSWDTTWRLGPRKECHFLTKKEVVEALEKYRINVDKGKRVDPREGFGVEG